MPAVLKDRGSSQQQRGRPCGLSIGSEPGATPPSGAASEGTLTALILSILREGYLHGTKGICINRIDLQKNGFRSARNQAEGQRYGNVWGDSSKKGTEIVLGLSRGVGACLS
jgi:hypothetical protein